MTEQVLDDEDLALASQIQLDSIYLKSCNIERRATGTGFQAGRATAAIGIRYEQEGDRLSYELSSRYEFWDDEESELADVRVAFTANYSLPTSRELSEALVDRFGQAVVFQTAPFQREFLATMTNRMAIPSFYLPLIRETDLSYEEEGAPS